MVVSGKDILARLSEWTLREFGTSFGAPAIARQMRGSEVPEELAEVIGIIEEGSSFPPYEERRNGSLLRVSSSNFDS